MKSSYIGSVGVYSAPVWMGYTVSLRLLAVPETWLIVRRWCITRFFSLLIGGLWKSPNWISPQFASQDETGPSRMPPLPLFELVCEIEREGEDGSTKRMKKRSVSVLSVFARHALHFPPARRGGCGAFEGRAVISGLLREVLEFHVRKLCHRVCAGYPKCDSVLFGQEIRWFSFPVLSV